MLVENRENRHAYIVGEVVGTKETDDYYLIQLKHHVWFADTKQAKDITTGVFVRNIEASDDGRPAIPYMDRAKKLKLHKGSKVGAYVRFSGDEDYKTANGYSVAFDGVTSFKGKNVDGTDRKYAIVMGTVKSMQERVSSSGARYTAANVYVGKYPIYDENGEKLVDESGNTSYDYRYVTVKTSNEKLMDRFAKALSKNMNGEEKNAAFLCFGDPYSYISSTTGDERNTYTAINFDVMGLCQK